MKVAVIGQGSIGRRHATILLELAHEVVVFDPDPAHVVPPGAERVGSFSAAIDSVDAAVIASPSSAHAAQARQALERDVPVFVEKPLAIDVGRAVELEWLARERGVLLAVGMNLRHHAGITALRDVLAEEAVGRVLLASVWCGSWLPGWRPGSDYRCSYSARADLGGGALLDVAVHELDYLIWLLGPAVSVTAVTRRVSRLELAVEDVALVSLELESGAIAEVTVNYFDQAYHRGCRIVGDTGTAHWSWEEEVLSLVRRGFEPIRRRVPSEVASTYHRELVRFLDVVQGKAGEVVQPSEARRILAIVEAARVSSWTGRRVELSPPVVLRPVEHKDKARLLAWRNDRGTQSGSLREGEVTSVEHDEWFDHAIADTATTIWIGEVAAAPVGQIRATRSRDGDAELHITVAAEKRNCGFGKALIVEAAGRILADPHVDRIIARIKEHNSASRRAFERAGFVQVGPNVDGVQLFERRPCG